MVAKLHHKAAVPQVEHMNTTTYGSTLITMTLNQEPMIVDVAFAIHNIVDAVLQLSFVLSKTKYPDLVKCGTKRMTCGDMAAMVMVIR